jgi:hypothetical protein
MRKVILGILRHGSKNTMEMKSKTMNRRKA